MISKQLIGSVQEGKGDASRWLSLYNAAYAQKLGMPIFPGSLNLALAEDFDWFSDDVVCRSIEFPKEEYGGERDVLLVPCTLINLEGERAFLWTTVTAARDPSDSHVVEVIAGKHLRARFGLSNGSEVVVQLSTLRDG